MEARDSRAQVQVTQDELDRVRAELANARARLDDAEARLADASVGKEAEDSVAMETERERAQELERELEEVRAELADAQARLADASVAKETETERDVAEGVHLFASYCFYLRACVKGVLRECARMSARACVRACACVGVFVGVRGCEGVYVFVLIVPYVHLDIYAQSPLPHRQCAFGDGGRAGEGAWGSARAPVGG